MAKAEAKSNEGICVFLAKLFYCSNWLEFSILWYWFQIICRFLLGISFIYKESQNKTWYLTSYLISSVVVDVVVLPNKNTNIDESFIIMLILKFLCFALVVCYRLYKLTFYVRIMIILISFGKASNTWMDKFIRLFCVHHWFWLHNTVLLLKSTIGP